MTTEPDGEPIIRRLAVGGEVPVLVADFDAFSDAPNLSVLLAELVSDRPVYQVDPTAILGEGQRYVPLAALAEAAVDAFTSSASGNGQVFVVGYCSAAGLAMRMAGLLARSSAVTVILARPTWPDDDLITTMFDEICEHIASETRPCPDLDADPVQVLGQMEAVLAAELSALAERMGLQSSAGPFGDLLDRYRTWLSFLLACRADTRPGVPEGVEVRDLGNGSPADLAAGVLAEVNSAARPAHHGPIC